MHNLIFIFQLMHLAGRKQRVDSDIKNKCQHWYKKHRIHRFELFLLILKTMYFLNNRYKKTLNISLFACFSSEYGNHIQYSFMLGQSTEMFLYFTLQVHHTPPHPVLVNILKHNSSLISNTIIILWRSCSIQVDNTTVNIIWQNWMHFENASTWIV